MVCFIKKSRQNYIMSKLRNAKSKTNDLSVGQVVQAVPHPVVHHVPVTVV